MSGAAGGGGASTEPAGGADWTRHEGRSNSSALFLSLVDEVARLIRGSAHRLITGDAEAVARLILAQLAHEHGLAPPGSRPPGEVARAFHEAYEDLAPSFGYETRRESAVPWEDVPEQNRRLMEAVAARLLEQGAIR